MPTENLQPRLSSIRHDWLITASLIFFVRRSANLAIALSFLVIIGDSGQSHIGRARFNFTSIAGELAIVYRAIMGNKQIGKRFIRTDLPSVHKKRFFLGKKTANEGRNQIMDDGFQSMS